MHKWDTVYPGQDCYEPTRNPALTGGSSSLGSWEAGITSHQLQSGEGMQLLESKRATLVNSQVLVPTIIICDRSPESYPERWDGETTRDKR